MHPCFHLTAFKRGFEGGRIPLNIPSREDLAWAAGFFDGEGHIGVPIQKHGKYGTLNKRLALSLVQTQEGPLERFQHLIGGTIYGPYAHNTKIKSSRRPYKQLHVNNFQAVQYAVCLLWPWLSKPKRAQVKDAFHEYYEYLKRPYVPRGPKPKKGKAVVN